jgi:hypothetical protein
MKQFMNIIFFQISLLWNVLNTILLFDRNIINKLVFIKTLNSIKLPYTNSI